MQKLWPLECNIGSPGVVLGILGPQLRPNSAVYINDLDGSFMTYLG